MKQIEQFNDIILRILRFLAESSEVTKLELFQRFPHCQVSRLHPTPARLRNRTSKLAQNCGKTEILHLQPSYGICWSHEIETLPPKDSSGFKYTIILSPDTELRATQSDPQEWPFPKRKAVVRGNPIFGSVEPCELLETRSSSHDASGSKSAFV